MVSVDNINSRTWLQSVPVHKKYLVHISIQGKRIMYSSDQIMYSCILNVCKTIVRLFVIGWKSHTNKGIALPFRDFGWMFQRHHMCSLLIQAYIELCLSWDLITQKVLSPNSIHTIATPHNGLTMSQTLQPHYISIQNTGIIEFILRIMKNYYHYMTVYLLS